MKNFIMEEIINNCERISKLISENSPISQIKEIIVNPFKDPSKNLDVNINQVLHRINTLNQALDSKYSHQKAE
jgi:hypothetical protein